MKWTGKLVGGALGLALGPVGAALGALAGHLYDEKLAAAGADARARRRRPGGDPEQPGGQEPAPHADAAQVAARFFRCTFEVMGHVAKADGRVSDREIRAARAVMSGFDLAPAQVAAAIAHFTAGKAPHYDLSRAIMALRRACVGQPDLLRVFLEIQMRAAIDGTDLRGPARPLLQRIAAMLGVDGLEFAHLEAVLRLRHGWAGSRGGQGAGERGAAQQRVRLAQAYEVLEVDAGASDEDVARAYRRQLSRHHPDKLKANGLPESMLEHAKRRTQQIIEAWDLVRERRNLP